MASPNERSSWVPFMWGFAKDLLAGSAGGMAGIVAGQPVDIVKVRLQAQSASKPLYSSSYDCASSIFRKEGPRSFFKGMLSPLMANAPINATIFTVYGGTLRHFEREGTAVTPAVKLFAGGLGGGVQCLWACPAELIKIQRQLDATPGKPLESFRSCVTRRVREAGWRRGLFQGWNATIIRDVPAFASYFWSYSYLKAGIHQAVGTDSSSSPAMRLFPSAMAGGCAGVVSWACTIHFDVLKSRVQSLPLGTPRAELGLRHCAVVGYRAEGLLYYVRGFWPAMLRAFPVSAVVFPVYESVMAGLEPYDSLFE